MTNPGWGAPRIHGELLKLGIDIGEKAVAKYMLHPRRPSSQTWKTFLKNHMRELVSADFFVVPTATFRLLFVSSCFPMIVAASCTGASRPTPPQNGQLSNFGTPFLGIPPLDTFCATAIAVTENPSLKPLKTWASRRF